MSFLDETGVTTLVSDIKDLADATYAPKNSTQQALDRTVRPNLLDNWYFVGGGSQLGYGIFPINQRGQASYSGGTAPGGMGIDRWLASSSVTLNSDSVNWSTGQVTGYPQFRQYLEPLPAGTYTVSLLAKVNSVGGTVWFCVRNSSNQVMENFTFQSATSGYQVFTFSFTLTAAATGYSVGFVTNEASTNYIDIDIKAIKLEVGNTQTLAHQENGAWVLNEAPNYSEELYRCLMSHAYMNDGYANNYPTPYRRIDRLSPGTTHALVLSDNGKTFTDAWSSTAATLDVLFTLSQANSSVFPVGAEIAFSRINSKSTKLTVTGVRLFNVDNPSIGSASGTATVEIAYRGMAVIKKIESNSASSGDVWLLTGNVEVVT